MNRILTLAALLAALTSPAGADAMNKDMEKGSELATFGGGCFWCLEAAFEELEGVSDVVSGYAGGRIPDPSYAQVGRGNTGHAEVVQIRFDPEVIGYEDLLDVFFSIHDPTTRNRQGADVGTQYRSIILTRDAHQDRLARAAIEALDASGVWKRPAVTEVEPLERFYPAESYHQDYFRLNPSQGYCQVVINPKMKKFRKEFAKRLK